MIHSIPPLPPLQQALQLGLKSSDGLKGLAVDVQTLPLPEGHVKLL